jgi:predicted secreted hydrolase
VFIYIRKSWHLIVLTAVILSSCDSSVAPYSAPPPAFQGASRLSELLRADADAGFPMVLDAREFRFPQDHGPHPAYRNEWWYFTGNLDDEKGARFGYELTIFRFALAAEDERDTGSAWETNQVYIGHLAITDVGQGEFHVAQRYSRGSVGLAGANGEPFHVWLDDWSVSAIADNSGWRLRAADTDMEIDLNLVAEKPVVLNGKDGVSQKSAELGNASYYYSIPRLRSDGRLRIDGSQYSVSGLSWLDREWGSSGLSRNQQGWDWFSLQLSDGNDLMFYMLRGNDGMPDEHSAGTWVDAAGRSSQLARENIVIEVIDFWENDSGDRYPSAWNVRIPDVDLFVTVTPTLDDQELVTNVRYWEGAVDVAGESRGETISGRGYVELTGYADE